MNRFDEKSKTDTHVKNTIDMFPSRQMRLDYLRLSITAQHLINRANNIQHFLFTDQSIPVQIVKSKYPLQFFFYRSSRNFRQNSEEFLDRKKKKKRNWQLCEIVSTTRVLEYTLHKILTSKLIFPDGFLFIVLKT